MADLNLDPPNSEKLVLILEEKQKYVTLSTSNRACV